MRKFFEGLSLVEGALFFSVLALGIFLRTYDLDAISQWSDELATIYYAKNLKLVFLEETHPPGFYLLVKALSFLVEPSVLNIRIFVALLSVLLCSVAVLLSRRIFTGYGFIAFTTLLFLLPVDIAYARMARMYAPFFELSLIFYLYYLLQPRVIFFHVAILFIISWLHPLGFLIPLVTILHMLIKRKFSKELFYVAGSVFPVICYYFLRLFSLSKKEFLADYLGGSNKFRNLFSDFFYTMAGEYVPQLLFYPVSDFEWWKYLLFSALVVVSTFVLCKREKKWLFGLDYFLLLSITSWGFVEVFSLAVTNIKLGRYLVYLIPVFLIFAGFLVSRLSLKWQKISVLGILGFVLIYPYNPLLPYPWEREVMQELKKENLQHVGEDFIFCGNRFQYDYYFNEPHHHCMHDYEKLKSAGRDFVFIDMNGFVSHSLIDISRDYFLSNTRRIGISTISNARYKKNINNGDEPKGRD